VSRLPTQATLPPQRGSTTYTWGHLTLVQKERVWSLLRANQTRRRLRAERQRQAVLRITLALLLAALGLLLVALQSFVR
jgi:hypothetical protein